VDVVLTVVCDEAEAQMVSGMLTANGIRSSYRRTGPADAIWTGTFTGMGPFEIIVNEEDAERARAMLPHE
jgi:hypothetical protein